MLKFSGLGASGLGVAWLLLPGIAQTSDTAVMGPRERALRQAQDERALAIASLVQLRTQIESGDTFARQQVLVFTETPEDVGPSRDQRLEELRRQVAELELVLEGTLRARRGEAPQARVETPGSTAGVFKIGLDDAELALIRPSAINGGSAAAAQRPATNGSAMTPEGSARPTPETGPRRPTADPLRQARAAIHAGRFDTALSLLESLPAQPQTLYWRARALERLGRLEEALGALRLATDTLSAMESPDEELAGRVRADLDYLEWLWQLQETRQTLRVGQAPRAGQPR
jgi:tetratricopeptide (TPR) repeat protein